MAFNEYATCANFSPQKIFRTGDVFSDLSETAGINNWSVSPNPVPPGSSMRIFVESANEVEASVAVYTMTGQQVLRYPKYTFSKGTTLEIPTGKLSAGIYLVAIYSENYFETKRVALVK